MVIGDRGSGKTTLIHNAFRMKREQSGKVDQEWDESTHCFVVDFEDTAWVVSHRAEDQGIAGITRETHPEVAQMALSAFIVNTLFENDDHATPPIWTLFTDLFPHTARQRTVLAKMTPSRGELEHFFQKFRHRILGHRSREDFPTRHNIQRVIGKFGVQPLIYLAAFSILAAILHRGVSGDTYLVFDNIDCIGSERLSSDVFEDICGLKQHLNNYLTEYVADCDNAPAILHAYHQLVQIVVARQTTVDIIASTRQEAMRWTRYRIHTSNVYDMSAVLHCRLGLYHSACLAEKSPSAGPIGDLATITGEPFVSRDLPRLFNGNERVLAYVLARLVDDSPQAVCLAADALRQARTGESENSGTSTVQSLSGSDLAHLALARGVVLRSVLRRLQLENYLKAESIPLQLALVRLKPRSTSRESADLVTHNTGVPMALCLLVLLDNISKGFGPDNARSDQGIRLDDLYRYFQPLFADTVRGLEALADALWRLYSREEDEIWCRLIRIDGLGLDGRRQLGRAARSFPAIARGPRAHEQPWVRISDAGSAFINLLFSHFEFALWFGSTRGTSPLLVSIHDLPLDQVIQELDAGIRAFRKLCAPMERVIATCYPAQSLFGPDGRPVSSGFPFVVHSQSRFGDIWQYYVERNVYTALRYVDQARWACADAAKSSTDRDCVNRLFAEAELNLLGVFATKGSQGTFRIRGERLDRLAAQLDLLRAIRDNPAAHWQMDVFPDGEF
jgi:hypothetical protein